MIQKSILLPYMHKQYPNRVAWSFNKAPFIYMEPRNSTTNTPYWNCKIILVGFVFSRPLLSVEYDVFMR